MQWVVLHDETDDIQRVLLLNLGIWVEAITYEYTMNLKRS